jgi:sugar phosphate isomerase/epimerase
MGADGVVDWHEWVKILRDNQWSGWGVAEIDMSVDPQREIASGIDYYNNELANH